MWGFIRTVSTTALKLCIIQTVLWTVLVQSCASPDDLTRLLFEYVAVSGLHVRGSRCVNDGAVEC